MIYLIALHGVLGLLAVGFGARLGRRALALGVIGPLATLCWLAVVAGGVLDGRPVVQQASWVPELGIDIDLRLDGFAALMVLLVSGIGVAVYAYGASYFPARGEGLGRLIGLLTLFSGSMLGLVLADNLLLLYTFWELTSVTSYLLIGNDHTKARARAAALQALLVTGAGALAMLGGFVLIGQAAGTFQLSAILADPPGGTAVSVGLVLVAIGAFTKSAQYPFQSWLPGAMVAPTPVSAYLHSATMVKAGVYLIARFAPAFYLAGAWRPLVVSVGLFTMIAGGLRALRQNDLKLLLAFGTVSQLGFMVVLFGLGTADAIEAGCVLLLAHGAFKATLFMVVGILDHETGTRDLRELPPLTGRGWRPVQVVAVLSAASMAGLPLVLGFIAKEEAYTALLDGGFAANELVALGVMCGSALTVAYSARFLWGAFVVPVRRGADPFADNVPARGEHSSAPSVAILVPAAVLTVFSVVLGLVPGILDALVTSADQALDRAAGVAHLQLWHGLEPALLLSVLSVGIGLTLFAARRPVERVLATGNRLPTGGDVYVATLRGLNELANRVTGVVQNGSMPVYTGVILFTVAALPAAALLGGGWWPGWPVFLDAEAQLPVAVLLIGAALGAAIVRRRFSAALLLGVVGYAMAALFVIQGAPDLALTQAAIETLSTVLFVLVLRRLPDRFERRSAPLGRTLRVVVSATVGGTVFAFMIMASASRTAVPVSAEMVERALPDGHGRNVVNVILVDFRGLDTLGEITVLAAAAIGAVALARAGRVPRGPGARPGAPSPDAPGAPGRHGAAPGQHEGAPGQHEGAPGQHEGAPGQHEGAPSSRQEALR